MEINTVVTKNPQKISDNVSETCFCSKCCQFLTGGNGRRKSSSESPGKSWNANPNGQKAALAWSEGTVTMIKTTLCSKVILCSHMTI